jgi:hypothetical protein
VVAETLGIFRKMDPQMSLPPAKARESGEPGANDVALRLWFLLSRRFRGIGT